MSPSDSMKKRFVFAHVRSVAKLWDIVWRIARGQSQQRLGTRSALSDPAREAPLYAVAVAASSCRLSCTPACLRCCSLMKELKELLTEGSSQVSAAPQAGNM